jgi:hypothetical protein
LFVEQPPSKDLFQTIPLDELVANSVEGLAESMVQRESDIISQMHVAHPHVGVTADPNNTTAAILKNAHDAMVRAAGGPDAREASIFYGQLIAAYVSEATNRVIGIALSGASPGQQFGAPHNPVLLCKGAWSDIRLLYQQIFCSKHLKFQVIFHVTNCATRSGGTWCAVTQPSGATAA